MSKAIDTDTTSSFIVTDSMNGHGAITVQETDGHATYCVVDYADSKTRERLASLTEGSTIRMEVERTGVRANVWKATKLVARSFDVPSIRA